MRARDVHSLTDARGIPLFKLFSSIERWGESTHSEEGDHVAAGMSREDAVVMVEELSVEATDEWRDEAGNHWHYYIDQDGACLICRVAPAGEILEVPALIAGHAVAAVAAEACASCTKLRRVTLPSSVRFIGRKAFAYCSQLEEVSLNEGLVAIGSFAFMNAGLRSLHAPNTLERIGIKAFYHCLQLTDVHLDEGLLALGDNAFAETAIRMLTIPASVIAVGSRILEPGQGEDAARISVHPDNARFLSDSTGAALYLRGPDGLTLLDYLGGGDQCGVLPETRAIAPGAFAQQHRLQEVTLPEGLLEIGAGAFRSCNALTSLALPSTLVAIGSRAFADTSLSSLELPASLVALEDASLLTHSSIHLFRNAAPLVITVDTDNPHLFVEGGVLCKREEDGSVRALMYAGAESAVRIPEAVTQLGSCLFYGATGIEELFVHDEIEPFSLQAFAMPNAIRHIRLSLSEPIEGHSAVDAYFSPSASSRHTFVSAFADGTFDAATLLEASDQGLSSFNDLHEMGRIALERLADPVLVDSVRVRYLRNLVSRSLRPISREFALRNYTEGFDRLADQGILTLDNFDDVLGWAREANGTASVGYLLEMKRERFGRTLMDEYDL